MLAQTPSLPDAVCSSERWVLITGATSGIGAAFARALAAEGYALWLTGRRMAVLDPLADDLRQRFQVPVETAQVELGDSADLDRLAVELAATPRLFGLVNNAGYADDGIFHLMSAHQHQTQMQVHMNATVLLTRAAVPTLEQNAGFVINVASLASWMPTPGSPLYGPTKGFVRLFTESMALTYHETGIQFQALCPGFVVTDFHSRMGLDPAQFYHKHGPAKAFPAEWVVARSLRDLRRGRVICSPGWHYKFLGWLIRSIPRPLLYRLLRLGMKSRYGDASR